MCSSPKSSGSTRQHLVNKGFVSEMNMDALTRFTVCANAAYERRQLRLAQQRKVSPQ